MAREVSKDTARKRTLKVRNGRPVPDDESDESDDETEDADE